MRPEKLALDLKTSTCFSQSILQKLKASELNGSVDNITDECVGGVIRDGQFAWIAVGAYFEVFSLKTGNKVASHLFDNSQRHSNTLITCVTEVYIDGISSCLLVVGVQCLPVGGLLYLFSVQGSRILHRIDVVDKVTSCCFISAPAYRRGNLKEFDGCVAVGTEAGKVLLIDLNLSKCREIIREQQVYSHKKTDASTCKIVPAYLSQEITILHHNQARIEQINFGIQLDVSDVPIAAPVLSILSMPQLLTIAVGLEDGLMVLYSLRDLRPFHLAYPPEADSPLLKLTYLEPADDPRAFVYIWAFHSNQETGAVAVMHSISFAEKIIQGDEYIYKKFQSCCPQLTMPILKKGSVPIACQSITKTVSDEEDELLKLCLLAWTNKSLSNTFVLVFDLNQWYKEQMPAVCDWREYPSYLAPFPVEITESPMDIWLNPKSVVTFNSLQRHEEHFYPTSLSFDLMQLTPSMVYNLHWAGLQNKVLKKLSATGAIAILLPDECFAEILETSLIPQLSEQNYYHSNPSTRVKQEFLLSMALEYKCMSLLKECARLWADGSHTGMEDNDSLTLSTLTDWIWSQATLIKDRCNNLCIPLFDHSGITIDLRSRKILAHFSRQLKLLADLLQMIVTNCRQYIPDEIFDTLCCQRNSIRMTSEYQEVLQWLLNMGLLPEVAWSQFSRHNSQLSLPCTPDMSTNVFTPVPYPYRKLNEYYTAQRQKFYEIDQNLLMPKTNSCKCLYIDSFLEHECNSHLLRSEWKNGLGDGLYPPPSLQAMLRILLVPGIPLENKYMLFVYLFLDLNLFLEDERHLRVVQNLIKFPAVFKLNSTLIKTTQAFWNLDHEGYETAIDELISPLTNDRFISQWQQELLVNTLLLRDMPHLALQALRAPGPSINTTLEIKTLLANNLITEAFELQRSKFDEGLLIEFYKGCHEHQKWSNVLGLALTEREGDILIKYLRTCNSLLSENLHLLYLLQRNKYIEALCYLDNLKYNTRPQNLKQKLENTQDLIFSAYQIAMVPSDRALSEQFLSIKDRIGSKELSNVSRPLSAELNRHIVDANLNIVGGVFHRALVSAKSTSLSIAKQLTENNGDSGNYVPFLSKPQINLDYLENKTKFNLMNYNGNDKPISYPTTYVGHLKRRKEIWYEGNDEPEYNQPAAKRQRTDSFSIADRPFKRSMGMNASLLTSFKSKNLTTPSRNQDLNATEENDCRNADGELNETVNLLSTPVVKSSHLDKYSISRTDRCQTPQSILKHRRNEIDSNASRRSTSPSLTVNSARRSVDFNEKSFRFGLSQQQLDASDEYRLTAIPEMIASDNDDNEMQELPYGDIKGRAPIHYSEISEPWNFPPDTQFDKTKDLEVDDSEENETSERQAEENTNTEQISKISRKTEEPESARIKVSARQRLRSATPETSQKVMSSTRITRSKSKLNFDCTDYINSSSWELNTSTPLPTPMKPLNEQATASNELKSSIKQGTEVTNAAIDLLANTVDSSRQTVDSSICNEPVAEDKQKDLLEDVSDVNESFMKRYVGGLSNNSVSVYTSDSSSVFTSNIQSRRNILQDTQSSGDNDGDDSKQSIDSGADKSQTQLKASDSHSDRNKIITEDQSVGEGDLSGQQHFEETLALIETKTLTEKVVETSEEEANRDAHKESEIEIISKKSAARRESHQTDVPTASHTELEFKEEQNRSEKSNKLTDTSVVSETFMKRYTEQTSHSYYSETSTIFSLREKNKLEDSSFGPILAPNVQKTDDHVTIIDAMSTSSSTDMEKQSENDGDEFDNDEFDNEGEVSDESENMSFSNTNSSANNSNDNFLYERNSDENDQDDDVVDLNKDTKEYEKDDSEQEMDRPSSTDDIINISSGSEGNSDSNESFGVKIVEPASDYDPYVAEDNYVEAASFADELAANLSSSDTYAVEDIQFGTEQLINEYNITNLQPKLIENTKASATVYKRRISDRALNQAIYDDLDDMSEITNLDMCNEVVFFDTFSGPREDLMLQAATEFETSQQIPLEISQVVDNNLDKGCVAETSDLISGIDLHDSQPSDLLPQNINKEPETDQNNITAVEQETKEIESIKPGLDGAKMEMELGETTAINQIDLIFDDTNILEKVICVESSAIEDTLKHDRSNEQTENINVLNESSEVSKKIESMGMFNRAFVGELSQSVDILSKLSADALLAQNILLNEDDPNNCINTNESVKQADDEETQAFENKIDESTIINKTVDSSNVTNILDKVIYERNSTITEILEQKSCDDISEDESNDALEKSNEERPIIEAPSAILPDDNVVKSASSDPNIPSTSSIKTKKRTTPEPKAIVSQKRSLRSNSVTKTAAQEESEISVSRSTRAKSVSSEVAEVSASRNQPRRAVSHQSLTEIAEQEPAIEQPKTRGRKKTNSESSGLESGLITKLDAGENIQKRQLRKATSHVSLPDIAESNTEEDPPAKGKRGNQSTQSERSNTNLSDRNQSKEVSLASASVRLPRAKQNVSDVAENLAKTRPKRAVSHQNLSDIAQQDTSKDASLASASIRSTRAKSNLSDVPESLTKTRPKRALSHQNLSDVAQHDPEALGSSSNRSRKKTISESNDVELESSQQLEQTKTTPKRNLRSNSRASDAESSSIASSPSHLSIEREKIISPTTQGRKIVMEQESPTTEAIEKKKSTRKRTNNSSKKDDDTLSQTSSIASTRSRRGATILTDNKNDDDNDKVSVISIKSKRSTRAGSALPAIAEDEQEKSSGGTSIVSENTSVDYSTSSRRLTRAQKATMEKYSIINRRPENKMTATLQAAQRKRKLDASQSNADEDGSESDESDSKSLVSGTSRVSKVSDTSKKSKASNVSRSSARIRALKK